MGGREPSVDTKAIHAGEPRPRIGGAVAMPVFQSSTYDYQGETDYHEIRYARLSNSPNHLALHAKLAALEHGEAALVTASGMAAISGALLAVLRSGDHLLAQDCLYGGTHGLITKDLPGLGIEHTLIDRQDRGAWERALRPGTKAIYVETLTNPLLQIPDLEGIVRFAREAGLVSIIDNTFASPVNFRPLEIGFDLSLHSATKYLNGHNDVIAGAAIGSAALIERIKHLHDHLGGALDPHACFLLHRGLKTLGVRVRRQGESASRIAGFLESQPAVRRVNYPGLASHAEHELAGRLFDGYGGMLSFELQGDVDRAERFLARLQIPIVAPSLGGVDSLIIRPAAAVHAGLSPDERAASGISDALIRLSVGLEDPDDLIHDIEQSLMD
ncbi:MAG: aminotransferase class I/II-fold pyridoxal phosphate-dependent enzyme [Gemmatimonadota bacterium]|nr:MAG: aminotransferase class I/II-fold pyridoxal phosphate-dependent enzyme [Gemmatimonadota bacterium]